MSTVFRDKCPRVSGGPTVVRQPAWVILAKITLATSIVTLSPGPKLVQAQGLGLPLPWKNEKREYGIPDSIVAVWTYAVAHTPGQPPVRGFGGRIMFYQDGREKPIKVDGTLVVYAFEETADSEQKITADRRYVFNPEELQRCYSQSRLGHSYSVWLPWDEAGGPQRTVSLIVCFTARQGPTVVSQQSKVSLPGPRNSIQRAEESLASGTTGKQPQVWTVPTPMRIPGRITHPAGLSSGEEPLPMQPTASLPGGPVLSTSSSSFGPGLIAPSNQTTPALNSAVEYTSSERFATGIAPSSPQAGSSDFAIHAAGYHNLAPGNSPSGSPQPWNPLRAPGAHALGSPAGPPAASLNPQSTCQPQSRSPEQIPRALPPQSNHPQPAWGLISAGRTLWAGPAPLEAPRPQPAQ